MASILLVCTGNVCRSPIAEGSLRARLDARIGADAPSVASAGTMGWQGSGADPNSIAAAAERGIDISDHIARRLTTDDVRVADVVIGVATEHAEAIVAALPEARSKVFTLKELVRLLEALPEPEPREPSATLRTRVREADRLRIDGFEGNPTDEDVADPLGMPLEAFREIALELEEWCGRLADGLLGPARARTVPATDGG